MPKSSDVVLQRKTEVKDKLANKLSFDSKKPLLAVFIDEDLSDLELKLLQDLENGFAALDINVLILSDDKILDGEGVFTIPYSIGNRELALEASDMALAFSFNDVEEMLMHGVIPISSKRKELLNYDAQKENGNSFIYKGEDAWNVFMAIVRAIETFKFPYDWQNIVEGGMGMG